MSGTPERVLVDLAATTDERREQVAAWLAFNEVPHEWEGWANLRVDPRAEQGVRSIVAGELPPDLDRAVEIHGSGRRRPGDPASVSQRIGATLIDGLVLFPANLPVTIWRYQHRLPNGHLPTGPVALTALFYLVQALYLSICVSRWGKTVGNRAVGSKVVSARDLGPVSIDHAVLRWLVPHGPLIVAAVYPGALSFLALLWWLVVYGPVLLGRPQGLHDRAAGTLVKVT